MAKKKPEEMKVGVIDYGMGNLLSVHSAFLYLGADCEVCTHPSELASMDKLVLPGVGAFGDCMKNLGALGFLEPLNEEVLTKRKPILGICLGMQVMADRGHEFGEHKGLGWFRAEVIKIEPNNADFRIPHIGWHEIAYGKDSPLFGGLPASPDVYFVHSFSMRCADPADVDAHCDYGFDIVAAVRKKNIFATQFHPEKSQDYGLRILENFLSWNPVC